jgi:hypothetical protein
MLRRLEDTVFGTRKQRMVRRVTHWLLGTWFASQKRREDLAS